MSLLDLNEKTTIVPLITNYKLRNLSLICLHSLEIKFQTEVKFVGIILYLGVDDM